MTILVSMLNVARKLSTNIWFIFSLFFLPLASLPFHLRRIGHLHQLVAFSNEHGGVTLFVWLAVIPVLMLGMWLLLRFPPEHLRKGKAFLLVATCVLAAPLFFTPPILSADVYHALFYGNAAATGHNPYLTTVATGPAVVFSAGVFEGYRDLQAPYGPLFLGLLRVSVGFFGNNGMANMAFLRAIMLCAHLLLVVVIGNLVRKDAPWRSTFILFLAWSPPLLMMSVSEMHPDVFLALGVGLMVWAAQRQCIVLALLVGVLAGLVKPTAFLLLPVVILWYLAGQWKERAKKALIGVGVAGVAAVLILAPFWAGVRTFDGIRQQARFQGVSYLQTPLAVLLSGSSKIRHVGNLAGVYSSALERISSQPLEHIALPSGAVRGANILGLLGFFAVFIWVCFQAFRRRLELVFLLLVTMFAFVLFGLHWQMPWYTFWFLPLITGSRGIARVGMMYLLVLTFSYFYHPVLGTILLGFLLAIIASLANTIRKDPKKSAPAPSAS